MGPSKNTFILEKMSKHCWFGTLDIPVKDIKQTSAVVAQLKDGIYYIHIKHLNHVLALINMKISENPFSLKKDSTNKVQRDKTRELNWRNVKECVWVQI